MINPTSLTFLRNLKEHNNREWFHDHKNEYQDAYNNVCDFSRALIQALAKIDPSIPLDLEPQKCIMRIYRDIRFSKDKTPYKTNFGIAISPNGKNFNGPGYYVHIQPGNSFVAAGSWYPVTEELKAIRQEIDYNFEGWRNIVFNENFLNAFGSLDTEAKLKTNPKGYFSDNPAIEFLKLKSFTASRQIGDDTLCSTGSVAMVTELFGNLYPMIVFLRNAIS